MCEFDTLTTAELLRATFAAQREAYQQHPERAALERVRDLIRGEVLAVLGVYERERGQWYMPGEGESMKRVSRAATIVARRVAARLSMGDFRVRVVPQDRPDVTESLVLRVDEVFWAMNKMFYLGDASRRRIMAELNAHPGWKLTWVIRRLTAVGALVSEKRNAACEFGGSWHHWGTAPGLELMLLRRDGSGFLDFSNGERKQFDALPIADQLPRIIPTSDVRQSWGDDDRFNYVWSEAVEKTAEEYHRNRANRLDSNSGALAEKEDLEHE
jgi:hypothetical protein